MLEELRDSLSRSYCSKGKFQHRKAEIIRLFPYVTHSPPPSTEEDFRSFLGISGEVSRQVKGFKKCKNLDIETVKSALESKVDTEEFSCLVDIIKKLAFDEQGIVSPFALSAFPYLSFIKKNPTLREIGSFLYSIFFSENESLRSEVDFEHKDDDNVLHSLIHESFPSLELESKKMTHPKYHRIDVGLDEVFEQDWMFLIKTPKLLHSYYSEFLKFYALIYQFRAVEQLERLFLDDSLSPIYFTLDWESCSSNRIAYQAGWKRLEPKIQQIYSHVNCIELLNHISPEGLSAPYTYQDFKTWCSTANESKKRKVEESLDCLIEFYQESISALANGGKWCGWEAYEPFQDSRYTDEVLNKSFRLFKMVECQFRNSHRNAPASRYASWIIQFATTSFIKRRGRIGNTLALSRDQILFLTQLVVGSKEKLRLHDYWLGLKRRGIDFDHDSRRKIVELFERLNLLEKKSDSGDAQYVRAII